MPSGRIFALSLAFGIYTRRTGEGRCEPMLACTCTAISARAWLVSATSPSIPAVLRPVLRCVTCRTLHSVLAQLRSISFWTFLAVGQSPSCTALKIRPRSRRTCSSWCRQFTRSQASPSNEDRPSGPFTEVSNLPISSGIYPRFASKAHLPTSAPLRAGHIVPYPASYAGRPAEEPTIASRFLFPFRRRHSLLGHPVPLGNSASFTVGLPERVMRPGPQPGFTRSARVRRGRGGCPLCPGAVVSLPAGQHPQPGTCSSQRLALHPAKASTCEARNHETSVKGSIVHPSGLLLARSPRVAREPFGFPPSSAPCRYRQRTSGRRQVIRTQTRGYTIGITEPPSYSPLNSCDLVSQCRLSAARHPLLGHPVLPGTSAPITVGLPHRLRLPAPEVRTLAGFTRSARVRPGPGRAPSIPRGQRCSLAIGWSVAAACRLTAAGPCHPGTATQPGMLGSRGISKDSLVVAPPVLPLACGRHGWDGGPWAFP